MHAIVVLIVLVATALAEQFSYEGYKVYRVHPSEKQQLKYLANLSNNVHFDYWSRIRGNGNPVDIMVAPSAQATFEKFLYLAFVKHEILIDNLEKVVQNERMSQLSSARNSKEKISFAKYHRHSEINEYLDQLAIDYSDSVSVETIGKSYEERELKVIKISTNSSANKPIIFLDAAIHAREWVAPSVALYAIKQLVENSENVNLLNKIDWHILPVLNPDGYEFTHTKQRFWRKTRSPGVSCTGADPNRNFDFHWAEIGSSNDECDDIYHGAHAFSEVEALAVSNYIKKNSNRIKLYLTLHSYGQYILFPWGYTADLPENGLELQTLGELVANSIRKVAGTNYTIGSSTNALYPAAGGSDDWVKGVAGVELSYTIELPGGGVSGFDPPTRKILPIVIETWEGLKTYNQYISEKFGKFDN